MIDACAGETLRRCLGNTLRWVAGVCIIVALAACSDGDNRLSDSFANGVQQTLTGSVGDGPIVQGDVFVIDANGRTLSQTTSDISANYEVTVPLGAALPLRVVAVAGTDLVTGRPADFPLVAAVISADQTTVNLSPLTTLATNLAERSPEGITEASLAAARDIMAGALTMGLDPDVIDAMYDPITEANVAAVVLANEALGEALRRTHQALMGTSAEMDMESLLGHIADDLSDGAIDGSAGETADDDRIAISFHAARAAVLLETAAGALHVDGADATGLMNASISAVVPDAINPPSVTSVAAIPELLSEARTSVAVLTQVVDDPWLEDLLLLLDQTSAGDLNAVMATELTAQNLVDLSDLPQRAALADDATLNEAATAAADLTNAAPPVLSFDANPTDVVPGGTARLSWASANADFCRADGDWSGDRDTEGTFLTDALEAPANYMLTCTGLGGTTTQQVAVTVNGAEPSDPPVVSLSTSAAAVEAGQSVNLSWSATNAESCLASGNWSGAKPTNGSEDSDALATDATFTLTCTGPGGSDSSAVSVSVTTPTPAPTLTLNASPSTVLAGESTTLSWNANNATTCVASNSWSGSRPTNGSEQSGPLSADAAYTLTCNGPGGTATRTVSVNVETPPAPNVSFSASATTIAHGETVALSWSASNATSCVASGGWQGDRATSGNEQLGPLTSDTAFTLTCSGDGGTTGKTVNVVVDAPSAPTITFTAASTDIEHGASTTLQWSADSATGCTASGDWNGEKPTEGSQSVGPLTTNASFSLSCTGAGGTTSQTVGVNVAPPPAPTLLFTAGRTSINSGESVDLSWSSDHTDSCTATGGWSGSRATSGNTTVGPLNSDTSFMLTCEGVGGSISRSVSINVAEIPAPTISLSASPTSVSEGASVELTWTTTTADSCTASGGWSGDKPTAGSQSSGALSTDTTFTLTCTGAGGSATQSASVTVSAPAPAVTIGAFPITIASGETTEVSWFTENASSCVASGDWSGQRATSGEETVGPLTENATFTLTCSGDGGSANGSASVTVTPPPAPTLSLSASPTSVEEGGQVELSWTTTNATTCSASGAWSGSKATTGTQQVGPLTSTSAFALTCDGPGGSVNRSVNVNVTPAADPEVSLSASAGSVAPGGSVTLTWESAGVDTCTASGNWSGTKPTSGDQSVGPINEDVNFNLNCTGSRGSAVAMTSVQVRRARLSWDAPTQNVDGSPLTDLGGFVVYYGNASRDYSQTVDINDATQTELDLVLTPGTWYFAVTAKDLDDNESAYSGEVSKTVNN